jgi:Mrp family chromosome partitioning ATPase
METFTNNAGERKPKHVIAIMSGKGGVGKSLVTSLLAIALQEQGFQVGIFDGDLTAPSIVHMFDPLLELSFTQEGRIEPLVSKAGIKIMSMRPFLEHETDATIWQGTMVASAFKQFYNDVEWGDLDYLLIDVPPGTSDVPMMILRALPLEGVIIVSSPQVIATVGVKKCINMIQQYHIPILGVVENMAYFISPGEEYCEPFGPGQGTELARLTGAPLLARLPLDPKLAGLCDAGRVEEYPSEKYRDLTRFLVL